MTPLLPREKATSFGIENLADHELVTLILGQGNKHSSVYKVAHSLTKRFPLATWKHTATQEFKEVGGCGAAKSWTLTACTEIGRRIFQPPQPPTIGSTTDAIREVEYLRHRQREEAVGLYLNARQELLKKHTLAIGGLNYTNIQARDVFNIALRIPCSYVILIHNHPSGDPQPSQHDLAVTRVLVAAGELLGIHILDHIIIGKQDSYSLASEGHLERMVCEPSDSSITS